MYENINFTIPEDLITKNFVKGIRLILQYQPDARIIVGQHDTIYFGNWYIEMYCEHKVKMASWGGYKEEDYWAFNV